MNSEAEDDDQSADRSLLSSRIKNTRAWLAYFGETSPIAMTASPLSLSAMVLSQDENSAAPRPKFPGPGQFQPQSTPSRSYNIFGATHQNNFGQKDQNGGNPSQIGHNGGCSTQNRGIFAQNGENPAQNASIGQISGQNQGQQNFQFTMAEIQKLPLPIQQAIFELRGQNNSQNGGNSGQGPGTNLHVLTNTVDAPANFSAPLPIFRGQKLFTFQPLPSPPLLFRIKIIHRFPSRAQYQRRRLRSLPQV